MTQQQANEAGRKAKKDGKALYDNPFPPFTYGYKAWKYGFLGKPW